MPRRSPAAGTCCEASASPTIPSSSSTRSATGKAGDAYRDALVAYFTEHQASAVGGQPRAARPQPPAHPRQQGRGRQAHRRRRADDPRASDRRRRPVLRAAASSICAQFGVPFVENPRIVRGLDYYGHTAFEFVTDRLGAQGTVMARRALRRAGGRDGWPADARRRLGGGHRAPRDAAARTAPPPPPRSR